jgi:alpha-glucosidase
VNGPPAAPTPAGSAALVHPPTTGSEWWRGAVVYQVYPRSFADSDGDGQGDLPGVTTRLEHLARLGVDALWLSPFYLSPQHDGGYDVADYRAVDPRYGTMADVDALLRRAHALGLRVVVDLVPNHTSDEHAWFRAALAAGPGSAERARYLFRDGPDADPTGPPNNWPSVFGGPAWTRVGGEGGQWYLHLFDVHQPDLDWSNPEVRAEFVDILRFWLDKGVDGFRVDVAHSLVKADGLPDWAGRAGLLEGSRPERDAPAEADRHRGPMWDQEGVHDVYREWHGVLAAYPGDRMLVAEAWVEPLSRLARYLRPDEMQQAFNFHFLRSAWRADALRSAIEDSLRANDAVGATTTWVLSNHDVVRHTSRLGRSTGPGGHGGIGRDHAQPDEELGLRRARAASLLMLALPGSAYLYQGEELGLPEHTTLDDAARQDPVWRRSAFTEPGRDGCRVPLPWDSAAPAFGFSPTGASWLPQPASFARYALDRQVGVPGSTYELYRRALALRREHRLGWGSLAWRGAGGVRDDVVAFDNGDVAVLTNLGAVPSPLPPGAVVLLASDDLGEGADGAVAVPPDTTVWFTGPPAAGPDRP